MFKTRQASLLFAIKELLKGLISIGKTPANSYFQFHFTAELKKKRYVREIGEEKLFILPDIFVSECETRGIILLEQESGIRVCIFPFSKVK